jgi:hypothetical protein
MYALLKQYLPFCPDSVLQRSAINLAELSAHQALRELISEVALQNSIGIECIDINRDELLKESQLLLPKRNSLMSAKLLELYRERKGLIFLSGGFHAEIVPSLQEKNVEVLYYYPCSPEFPFDLKAFFVAQTALQILINHVHVVPKAEIDSFDRKVLSEVESHQVKYVRELVEGTSHSVLLCAFFHAEFKAFMREGYYVDALLEVNQASANEQSIAKQLTEKDILYHYAVIQQKKYLVIPDINSEPVWKKIYQCATR